MGDAGAPADSAAADGAETADGRLTEGIAALTTLAHAGAPTRPLLEGAAKPSLRPSLQPYP